MKAVVAAFNQEKALVGAFSVITNLRMELFQALLINPDGVQLLGGDTARLLDTAEMMDADLVRILGSQHSQQHVTGEW